MVDKQFKLIAVTPADVVEYESIIITLMLTNGIDRVHLRHPGASAGQLIDIIYGIPTRLHNRISLHDHHEIREKCPDLWPHLNSRQPAAPQKGIPYSRSCHSLDQALRDTEAQYCFVSPIFDSLSKFGYKSQFSIDKLQEASSQGLITPKMIALGGVEPTHLPLLRKLGFGGAAMLGYIWSDINIDNIITRINAAIHYSHQ